jgi:CubicO group peptidase (beta-lactamase class C family)
MPICRVCHTKRWRRGTKLTAALVFGFIDGGQLALTTRFSEIISELDRHGVTVRDALSHQTGVPMQRIIYCEKRSPVPPSRLTAQEPR